jgi:glutathione S-transferase
MEWVIIISVLVLLQYTWFAAQVGAMRARHNVKAPAMSGAPEFERMCRVHYNTMEQLVMFLPLMWIFANYVNATWAAGFGVVFLVARFIYRSAYLKDPSSRRTGATLTILPSLVMAVWLLIAAIRRLL